MPTPPHGDPPPEPLWIASWRASLRKIEHSARLQVPCGIDPRDLVEDAFLWLWREYPFGVPPPDDLIAYINGRFRNSVKKFFAERSREESLPESGLVPTSTAAPSARLEGYEEVQRLLPHICSADRRLLYRHFVLELTYRELATELQMAEGTIKARISRAARKLRGNASSE